MGDRVNVSIPDRDFSGLREALILYNSHESAFQSLIGILVD